MIVLQGRFAPLLLPDDGIVFAEANDNAPSLPLPEPYRPVGHGFLPPPSNDSFWSAGFRPRLFSSPEI
jgi:hypothetical protein